MATIRTDKPGNSLEETSHQIGERIQGALEDAQTRLTEAGQKLSRATSRAKDLASDRAESLATLMSEHPVATIAVGLGVGFLIGRLMARD